MTAVIFLWVLSMLACAATIWRLSGELKDALNALDERTTELRYTQGRNAWLHTESDKFNTKTASTSRLPAEHPQKRKPKAIRGKRK